MATYREERIRQLAHQIWEREGHPHGRDTEHWRLATQAYEAETVSSRLDDAGQPVGAGAGGPQEGAMRPPSEATPQDALAAQPVPSLAATQRRRRTKAEMAAARAAEATAPKAGRGRKAQPDVAAAVTETVTGRGPATRRKRRTKAEMAAAAAGVAGATAAVVAAVAVTKRRRGVKAETTDEAAPAPAADAALRRPRKPRQGTTLAEQEPASAVRASGASREALGAAPDPSADGPSDLARDLIPDPAAEPPR